MNNGLQNPINVDHAGIRRALHNVLPLYKHREELKRYGADFRVVCLVLNLGFSLALINSGSGFWFWSLFGLITLISLVHLISWFFPIKSQRIEEQERVLATIDRRTPYPEGNEGFPYLKELIQGVYLVVRGAQLSFLGVYQEYERDVAIFANITLITAEILIHFAWERKFYLGNIRRTIAFYENEISNDNFIDENGL